MSRTGSACAKVPAARPTELIRDLVKPKVSSAGERLAAIFAKAMRQNEMGVDWGTSANRTFRYRPVADV